MNIKKKYIRIITNGNFPYGGASANFLRNLSLGLSELGNDVTVLLPKGNYYGNYIEKGIAKKGNIKNVKYIHLCFAKHPRNYLLKAVDIFYGNLRVLIDIIISKCKGDVDVLLRYNVTISTNLALAIVAKILKVKLLIIVSEYYEKPNLKKFSLKKLKWFDFYWGIKNISWLADGFIVLSGFLENYISSRLKCKKPIIVQPNIIDPSDFNIETKATTTNNSIIIGYSGTPTRKDGIYEMLDGFKLINSKYENTNLLIIGDITNGKSSIPKLKTYCKEIGIENKVKFTGLVPFEMVSSLLNSCNILVLIRPNGVFAEAGFPTKLGEYFACKKPVVITKVGDIAKHFTNKKDVILIEPDKPKSFFKGVELLINDPLLSKKIAENGYSWMQNNLHYLNVASRIDNFINSAL